MEKLRVLFVHTEVYNNWQLENLNLHVKFPLSESMPGDFEVHDHVYAHRSVKTEEDFNYEFQRLVQSIHACRPHVVLISQAWNNFPPDAYQHLRTTGAKIVTVIWDTQIQLGLYELGCLVYGDYTVNIDSITNHLAMRIYSDQVLHRSYNCASFFAGFHLPKLIFHYEERPMKYPVVMLGSAEGYRRKLVEYLQAELPQRGIEFHRMGGLTKHDLSGRADEYLEFRNYVETIWQSSILLCSQTVESRRQLKGKVLEFLACGGFVLVDRNFEYEVYLPPGVVAYYDSLDDLVAKIEHYQHRPEERHAIARRGHQWFNQTFGQSSRYWEELIRQAAQGGSLPVPTSVLDVYRKLQPFVGHFHLQMLNLCGSLAQQAIPQIK